MKQRKKGMQDIDVTKKEGVNELSDDGIKNASGGTIDAYLREDGPHYVVSYFDAKGNKKTIDADGVKYWAVAKDKAEGGTGEVNYHW